MAISATRFLEKYFALEELREALSDINESTSGTKSVLISRVISTWQSHNRTLSDILDILDHEVVEDICHDFNIDESGDTSVLIRRIVRARLVQGLERTPDNIEENQNSPRAGEIKSPGYLKPDPNSLTEMVIKNKKLVVIFTGVVAAIVITTTVAANMATVVDFLGRVPQNPGPELVEEKGNLPTGTQKTTGNSSPNEHVIELTNPGPQTVPFKDPIRPIKGILTSVTTYVDGAVLLFTVDGTTYSDLVEPNSNTLFTFPEPLDVSNVRISIQEKGYPNDAAHIQYIYP